MRKETLEKRVARLEGRKAELTARALASESADEVRNINKMLGELNEDIADLKEEIASLTEERAMSEAKPVNAGILGAFSTKGESRDLNPLESMEYRKAFMAYVQKGSAIPAEYRSAIASDDVGPAIPLTIMREVINTVRKRYGNLYRKVRKTSMQGGVEYPIGALQATFKWITEATVAPREKLDKLGKISFQYHTAEIRISQTFLANLLVIDDFETKLTEVIAVAYAQAMDYGIINGTGNGQMLGILNDPRVAATGNTVAFTAAQLSDWTEWRKNFFAKLPLGYRDGEFIFPVSTVDAYLETMADSNNNPIFRQATGLEVNDGDAANPNGRFFGRDISLVEPDILPDFDDANSNDVIGIYWQPDEYAINENFGFTMRRYFDEETNEWVNKALCVVDGKVLNPNGIWLITKA